MKKAIAALSGIFLSIAPCQARMRPEESRLQPKVVSMQTPLSEKDAGAIQPISFEELTKFSTDWTAYAEWLKKSGKESSLAYAGVNPSRDYPEESRKFLEKRDWTVDRFFHLERIIREALSYLIQAEKYDAFAKQIDNQIRALQANASLTQSEKNKLEEQLRLTASRKEEYVPPKVPVSPEEMELIKANRASLQQLMSR